MYLLYDNGDVQYFCCVREDTAKTLFIFTSIKNAPVE